MCWPPTATSTLSSQYTSLKESKSRAAPSCSRPPPPKERPLGFALSRLIGLVPSHRPREVDMSSTAVENPTANPPFAVHVSQDLLDDLRRRIAATRRERREPSPGRHRGRAARDERGARADPPGQRVLLVSVAEADALRNATVLRLLSPNGRDPIGPREPRPGDLTLRRPSLRAPTRVEHEKLI